MNKRSRRWLSKLAAILTGLVLAAAGVIAVGGVARADGPTTFTNATSIDVPATTAIGGIGPASPYPSTVTVAGMTGAVTDVAVTLNSVTASSLSDFDVLLVAPNGANLIVMSDIRDGGLAEAFNATYTISDAAASPFPSNTSKILTGTYRPTNLGTTADTFPGQTPSTQTTFAGAFTGVAANGTWSLYIVDDNTLDTGRVAGGWDLTITTAVAAVATTTTVTTSNAATATGDPVTFTATVAAKGSPVTTGTVQFADGSNNIGLPVPLSGAGTASLTYGALTEGTHTIRATYNGATGLLTSNGTVSQRVDTTTTVTDTTFCNNGGLTVPDVGPATPYPSNITVSGLGNTISKVTAQLKSVSHTSPGDLDILLSGPSSKNLLLLSDVGGPTGVSGANLTFDDSAAKAVPIPITSGTYRPTNLDDGSSDVVPPPGPSLSGATALSTFQGVDPNGTWSLWVNDDATGDSGSIGGWCLTITAQSATSTVLTSSVNPSSVGQPVTLTATVTSGGSPVTSGTVALTDGPTPLGTATVNASGIATLTTSALTLGSHQLTATFDGTATLASSFGVLTQVVDKIATSTVLTSTANPSTVGQSVTLTATVTSGGVPVTSGAVDFADGATPLGTANVSAAGLATLTTSALSAGSHPLTATFTGTATLASSSGPLAQGVDRIATSTGLTSSATPTTVGQSVTLTATVTSGGVPVTSGTVDFTEGATLLASRVALDAAGVATATTSALSAGSHQLTAAFTGTATLAPSSGNVTQVVNKTVTSTVLRSSVNPSTVGQSVTFTATVTAGGSPVQTGSVDFAEGATLLSRATLNAAGIATFTTSALSGGPHTLTATFTGTPIMASSSGPLTQVVDKITTSTALTSSLNPSTVGQSVTFTATVTSGGAPVTSGAVDFTDGATPLGTANVNAAGIATLTTSALSGGSHPLTATYTGTAALASSSGSLTQVVDKIVTSTALTSSLNPSTVGQSVTLSATVTAGGSPVTSGTVDFAEGATQLGSAPVDASGIATLSTSALTAGSHTLTATFTGTPTMASSSGPLTQVVDKIATSTTVTTSPASPTLPGVAITLTAAVTGAGTPVDSGTVEFAVNAVVVGTAPVRGGAASLDIGTRPLGAYVVTATYSGAPAYAGSTSAAVTHVVDLRADAGGPYTVAEGGSVQLTASGPATGVTYSWDVNGDGTFGDATGRTPTLSWADLGALGIGDGPATFTVRVRISAGGTDVDSAPTTLTVTNTAPTVTLGGDIRGTAGQAVTVTLEATDPSAADTVAGFTFTLDWGDGSPVQTVRSGTVRMTASGAYAATASHTYAAAGTPTVTVTATDRDGSVSAPVSTVLSIAAAPTHEPTPKPTPSTTTPPGTSTSGGRPVSPGSSVAAGRGLAQTGSSTLGSMAVLGLALISVGAVLVVSRRYRPGRRMH